MGSSHRSESGIAEALWQIAHSLAAIADALEGQGNGLYVEVKREG